MYKSELRLDIAQVQTKTDPLHVGRRLVLMANGVAGGNVKVDLSTGSRPEGVNKNHLPTTFMTFWWNTHVFFSIESEFYVQQVYHIDCIISHSYYTYWLYTL